MLRVDFRRKILNKDILPDQSNRDTAMRGHYQESHAEIETPEVPFEHKVLNYVVRQ